MPPVCLEADASDPTSGSPRVALLIDADNISYRNAGAVLAAARSYGDVQIGLAFGDWSSPHPKGWLPRLRHFGLSRGPAFIDDPGKNVTDAHLMIVAMDLSYANGIDVICIASGDADFAPLAARLACDRGLTVVGIGPSDASRRLVDACDHFDRVGGRTESVPDDALDLLLRAFEGLASGGRPVRLARLGYMLHELAPSFQYGDHGCSKLRQLVERYPSYLGLESDPDQPTVLWVYPVS